MPGVVVGDKVALKMHVTDADIAEVSTKQELTDAEALTIGGTNTEVQDLNSVINSY